MKPSTNILKNELSPNIKVALTNIFRNSIVVYNSLLSEAIFQGDLINNIKGWLLSYIIEKHFSDDLLPKNFPIKVFYNPTCFKKKRLELKTENFILTISRVYDKGCLPRKCGFRKLYSERNHMVNKQIMFDIDNDYRNLKEKDLYAIITYNISDNELSFINIVMPDSSYNCIVDSLDFNLNIQEVKSVNYVDENSESLITIQNLKKKVLEGLEKEGNMEHETN